MEHFAKVISIIEQKDRNRAICGRKYWKESSAAARLTGVAGAAEDMDGTLFGMGAKLIRKGVQSASGKKDICPDCRRAGYTDASGSGSSSSSAASRAAQEEEDRRKKAAHREAIESIKDMEFPEDDNEFTRTVNRFCDDYLECNSGLFADGEYKKTYKKTAERELKNLKDSNPAHYEKFKEQWEAAVATKKKSFRIRLIISGVILLAIALFFGIGGAVSSSSLYSAGTKVGIFFWFLSHWSYTGLRSCMGSSDCRTQ